MRILRFIWSLFKYILTGNQVTKVIYEDRLNICYSCKYLNDTKCGVCGCYVKLKAKWSTETCPKNKW